MGILLSKKIIESTSGTYTHWCPGCKSRHMINTTVPNSNNAIWFYNGDHDSPTFRPSVNIRTTSDAGIHVCHYIITDGKIAYCADTTHKFAEQTLDVPDFPDHIISYHTKE